MANVEFNDAGLQLYLRIIYQPCCLEKHHIRMKPMPKHKDFP